MKISFFIFDFINIKSVSVSEKSFWLHCFDSFQLWNTPSSCQEEPSTAEKAFLWYENKISSNLSLIIRRFSRNFFSMKIPSSLSEGLYRAWFYQNYFQLIQRKNCIFNPSINPLIIVIINFIKQNAKNFCKSNEYSNCPLDRGIPLTLNCFSSC